MSLIRILALAVCGWLVSGVAAAQSIEPADDWQSADTAHFRINYRAPWRAQAERVAQVAERVYPKVTQNLAWEPRGRTEILLIDQYDLSNGYATPLPFNMIGVFLAPPDEGELLDNSDWLELLITHEFTHTVHLDKVRGVPSVLQTIFGRQPYFFPNLFQPSWVVEGLAVHGEGDPAAGRGRLRGPVFEAWLRAEAKNGFLSLREINADGRSLPVSKSYLYGSYFFDFLARKYGPEAAPKFVQNYSGNPPFWPRLSSSPYDGTGKTMDVLWDEFLVDLKEQVAARAQPITAVPEAVGERLAGPLFGVGAVASLPDGATLAVLDDGLRHAKLVKFGADGKRTELGDINRSAVIDVAADGRVLVAQPDICNWRYLAYDLYRLKDNGSLDQLTHCARLRHAVQAGDGVAALQQGQGRTRLVLLDAAGQPRRTLWEPEAEVTLVDLAASPDGKQLSVISKRAGAWRVDAFDLAEATPSPRLLFTHDAPLHGLVHGPQGLEFIAVRDGVFNVWRLENGAWAKLTHTHTRVAAHGGTRADGSLAFSVVAPGGYELRRIAAAAPQQRVQVGTAVPALPGTVATPVAAAAASATLGAPQGYSSLRSLYPRNWLPLTAGDKGLFAVGASTFGSDALGWHQYAASLAYETTQKEAIGSLQYLFRDQHLFTFQRTLTARAWENNDQDEDITAYDRNTEFQWMSFLPWHRLDRRITFGLGAAMDDVERVNPQRVAGRAQRTERLAAVLIDYSTTGSSWWSEGSNRGQHATLLYETYKPFKRGGHDDYDGEVLRLDWRGFIPIGRTVLALRHTEARASGFTEAFQLGGAIDPQLQLGVALNNRDITLRGYRGNERFLVGTDARATSIEWRTPLADVDRHFMSPAVGMNRLSAAAFFDIGGAWNTGNRPTRYYRGVGVELLGELKVLYSLGVQVRVGVAKGLDGDKDTEGYIAIGRGF